MTDRAILAHPVLPAGRTVAYGTAPHQVYEVFGQPATARGWVVLVHGGFWRAEWDRTHLRPLAAAMATEGYAAALVEYVRTGMPGGGWDGTSGDVAAALAAVRRESDGAAGGEAPVVLAGHSAGGHLAVWLLHRPEAEGVRGAVSLGGCLDLTMAAELGLGDAAAHDLMGGPPTACPDRYDEADPARLGPAPAPVVVVHGTSDEAVPPAVAVSWWGSCARPERDSLVLLDGVSHFPLIDPAAAAYPVLLEHLERLLPSR